MGASGTGFTTHHAKAYARGQRSHPRLPPPGCNRTEDSSLAFSFKSAKQDN